MESPELKITLQLLEKKSEKESCDGTVHEKYPAQT